MSESVYDAGAMPGDDQDAGMSEPVAGDDSGMATSFDDEMSGGQGGTGDGMSGDQGADDGMTEPPSTGGAGPESEDPPRRRCSTMDVHRRLLSESAQYASARAAIENAAASAAEGRAVARTSVVTIPVVVHVVYNTAGQNISDAQIQSQISVLNEDFRALNPDVSSVPAVFEELVADSKIQFALATRDPDGNPHSGVIRKSTTVTSFGSDDKMKFDATGGSDAWPADRYLNVWVCRLNPYLGYAQFPGGDAETDGVVILDTAFGTTGTAAAPFDKGRTTTHEIGHWLNLFHIWGDDGTGCSGSDQVADTPNQGGENYGCPTFPNISCGNGPNGDLFVNYMDYVDDACMVMFTHGQVNRMDATLAGPRSGLVPAASGGSDSGPVVSWGSDRLDAFVIGTDSALHHKWWNGSAWGPSVTGYEFMGGRIQGNPEVASWGSDRLDVFVKGMNSGLYHKWWNGSSWGPSVSGYESMGGRIRGNPKAVAWGPDRLDVFVIGMNTALYHKWWNGSSWGPSLTGYEQMGGRIQGDPEVVSWGSNRLDVFVKGMNSGLYHKWWNGSSWGPSVTGYEFMGGHIRGNPKAVAWGADRLDVFVVGMDSKLYHKWWNGSSWGPSVTGYESLGGTMQSDPAVVSWGPNRLDVFVVGTDSRLYHKWWDGSSWGPSVTGWEDMGGTIVGEPHVVSWGPNRLDVFVVGTDSRLYHKWWDGSSWGPSVTGYESLGGSVTTF